jgi:hypothetical protein
MLMGFISLVEAACKREQPEIPNSKSSGGNM